jgi:hypothetical protein
VYPVFAVVLTWNHDTASGWLIGAILFHGDIDASQTDPQLALGSEEAVESLAIPELCVRGFVLCPSGTS